ncbi:hypothetical protein [Luteimonas sp. MC1825]|uniref:hypothetical protein n=1 Tax=Luteimonas sp. MC1825 TaxID=2761107 RepID=UPI0016113D86|nr:hypothetical protein [Luteimonas sp. MC1825]MBB6599581.1 hypothetical protein [Luteimonas sp. MC1825]QOC87274.1 hypothetical protein IDM46_08260 [Luteimonas sp. MC1825]
MKVENGNDNVDVVLDVRNFASSGSDGYTTTTGSNGRAYSYRYTGGTDDAGGVEQTADGESGTITVTVGLDPRYQVDRVDFTGDIESQLSWAAGPSPRIAVITDSDTSSGDGAYAVIVKDTTANCTLPCDPPIKNKPVGQTQTK